MPERAAEREPTHLAIIKRIDELAMESRVQNALLKGEINGRFDGVDTAIEVIRKEQTSMSARLHKLENAPVGNSVAPAAEAPGDSGRAKKRKRLWHSGGIPFEHGWRSWGAVAAIAITILVGLRVAFATIDWLCGGFVIAWTGLWQMLGHLWHYLTTTSPPQH